ncbi:hypothetical protein ASPWEDRAFT_506779 [Aspergillus wentii DTO 134E9]|uniref:F-box domain-containing protein n=1 Tax=Aspergillus wentii DTO 134E9 TaxID=1073089 RepID=A0A1L9RKA7_ASPWE|nr:uncharacterized protein ASPWEDRAFT_506779 [Aspergillus wentii DTO 134E9]OJJ35366.1 hypothetical protein ASPWEDRAFT_506779 [Aspergillus wentii DTO 134E9]
MSYLASKPLFNNISVFLSTIPHYTANMKGHLHWIEKILDHQKHPVACSNRTLPTTQFLEAILSNIFDLLPVLDQVCFALTCKHFYAYFRAYLNNRKLFLPDLFRETRLILCRNVDIESRARTQLLRRLEDANWKYCFQCWTLHPHSAWQHPKGKSCLDCQQLNGRRCMPYAGIVDLCPCLSITKCDQVYLIKRQSDRKRSAQRAYRIL